MRGKTKYDNNKIKEIIKLKKILQYKTKYDKIDKIKNDKIKENVVVLPIIKKNVRKQNRIRWFR